MEITKVVKPFIRRGANTFGNIVYHRGHAQITTLALKGPLYEANPFLNYTFELCYK